MESALCTAMVQTPEGHAMLWTLVVASSGRSLPIAEELMKHLVEGVSKQDFDGRPHSRSEPHYSPVSSPAAASFSDDKKNISLRNLPTTSLVRTLHRTLVHSASPITVMLESQ